MTAKPELTLFERSLSFLGLHGVASDRLAKRMEFEAARAYYKAAAQNRKTGDWERDRSITENGAFTTDALIMKERAKALFKNNGYGNRCTTALVDGLVGEMIQTQINVDWFPGWKPTSQKQINDKREANLNKNNEYEELKKYWYEIADITGQLEWGDMQRLTASTTVIEGECLKQSIYLENERFPLRYKLMSGDRLATTDRVQNVTKGNEVINGIEYGVYGEPVAYHMYKNSMKLQTYRVEAKYMKHTYRMDLPEQGRGVTWYAPIIPELNDLINVNNYALISRKVQSAISLVTSKRDSKSTSSIDLGSGSGNSDTDSGLKHKYLSPGSIIDVGDRNVHSHIPTPSSDLDPLTKLQLRGVAVGFGMSYELLSGDYRDTTFAGGRLAKVDTDRRFDGLHTWYIRKDEKPCHKDFMESLVLGGHIRSFKAGSRTSNPNTVNINKSAFSRRKMEWGVNPLQEVKAVVELIKSKSSTYRAELEARGVDFEDHVKQLANESDLWNDVFDETPDAEEVQDISKEDNK